MAEASPPPRFVPTLTEVVQLPAGLAPSIRNELGIEPIIQRVLDELEPTLESRLLQGLDTVMLEQLEALESRLQQKIKQVVREAVAQAVEQHLQQQETPK